MTAESLDEDERLVNVVKNYPNLYDTTLVSYRDNVLRDTTWTEIGKLLGAPADNCNRRWRLLRDRYVREKKRLQCTTSDGSERVFPNGATETKRVFAQMDFVGHYIKHRNRLIKQPLDSFRRVISTLCVPSLRNSRKRTKLNLTVPSLNDNDQDLEEPESAQTFRNFESLDQQPQLQSLTTATEFVLVPAASLPAQTGQGQLCVPPETPARVSSNGACLYRVEAGNATVCASVKKVDKDAAVDAENGSQEKSGVGGSSGSSSTVPTVREDVVRTQCELGEEEHFALSVAATLKRLPPRTKALAKLNIQKILYDIEFQGTDH